MEKFEIFEVNLLHGYPNVFRKERTVPFQKSYQKMEFPEKDFLWQKAVFSNYSNMDCNLYWLYRLGHRGAVLPDTS